MILMDIFKSKREIIKIFLNSNEVFNESTPDFILEDLECINASLNRDINSVNYLQKIDDRIIDKVIKSDYIIKKNSPIILKSNYTVSLNSIKLNSMSANYIQWDKLTDLEQKSLIDEIIKSNYILSSDSPKILCKNKEIVLSSIKKDINSARYASEVLKNDDEIFKYLILSDYKFESTEILYKPLSKLCDTDILSKFFEMHGLYGYVEDPKYRTRYNELIRDSLLSIPTINTFNSVFFSIAEVSWKNNRKQNINDYENIFGKICSALRQNKGFRSATTDINCLTKMEEVLGSKYEILYSSIKKYYRLYHSDISNKMTKLESIQDTISNLSALYVAKSKENYKKNLLIEYHEWIKPYFKLRLDNPYIASLIKKQENREKKEIFKSLYLENNLEVMNFLNNIVNKYNEYLDDITLHKLIDFFVLEDCSNLSDIIEKPLYYNEYLRYKDVLKLINRLSNKYIKYSDLELNKFRDIIKYDEVNKIYIYTGITDFLNYLNEYNSYQKKYKIFGCIKREIMDYIMDINSDKIKIKLDEVNVPFNDEYYVFNSNVLNLFNFLDLEEGCLSLDGFNIDSIIDDKNYKFTKNFLINNGIIWLLLFMNHSYPDSLYDSGFNKKNVLKIIDEIPKIVELLNIIPVSYNYLDVYELSKLSEIIDSELIYILGMDIIKSLYNNQEFTGEDIEIILRIAKELAIQMIKKDRKTVPYINGEYLNYYYYLYDNSDLSIFESGPNCDSCFKVDGIFNDAMHYSLLDKNGFVIKITDKYKNFIGRAFGMRCGNYIFINQLRTIYDCGGNSYDGISETEKNDIIATFVSACQCFLDNQENNNDKIDFIFITKSYIFKDYESNVSEDIKDKIGEDPMDNESKDWFDFIDNTENLQEDKESFSTDYRNYDLICIAKSNKELNSDNIKRKDVEAIYKRSRSKIIVDKVDINRINRIKAIKSCMEYDIVKYHNYPDDSIMITGDNWFIVYNDKIIDKCILSFDKKAKEEYEMVKNLLEEMVNNKSTDIGKKIKRRLYNE